MTDHHELDDFREVLQVLHEYSLESPTLNTRGIPRLLERLRNVTAEIEHCSVSDHLQKAVPPENGPD